MENSLQIPTEIRNQILRILSEASNADFSFQSRIQVIYDNVVKELDLKFGTFHLGSIQSKGSASDLSNFILESRNIEGVLFAIELLINRIAELFKTDGRYTIAGAPKLTPTQAISDLNICLRQSNLGYAFEGGQIVRFDSTIIHQEITRPTISLLSNEKFAGANQEYMKALEHWKNKNNKECLTHCGMAFESVLKSICTIKGWEYDSDRDTANDLLNICITNGLIPTYIQNQFTSLKSLLSSGVPTIRNRRGAHGQGPQIVNATDEITRYGLNLTASNLIFLIEQSGIK